MFKKISIILLLVIIAGGATWYFFGNKTSNQNPDGTDSGTNFFPFGQGGVATTTPRPGGLVGDNTDPNQTIDLSEISTVAPKLRKVWNDQVAGASFVTSGTTTTGIRFVDRATGHIYETSIDSTGEAKISNVTIPQVYETVWAKNSKQMVTRYLKDGVIQSFYASLSDDAPTIEGYFLPSSIKDIYVFGTKMMYFEPGNIDGLLVQTEIDGSKKATVSSLGTSDWSLSWNNDKLALLTTRPSGNVDGHSFILDISKGTISKAVQDIKGLMGTMAPSGEVVLMSGAQNNSIITGAYNVASKKTAIFPLNTLSDKCGWSNKEKNVVYCAVPTNIPSGIYPDDWYKGLVSFNDRLWKIDMFSGETDLISDLEFEAAEEMDITKIIVDASDKYIMFTNKKDMGLWVYEI